jgi:hypothetical protein
MASKIVVRSGVAAGVYDDRWLPMFEALGCVEVARASVVEYEGGLWVARLPGSGEVIASGRIRSEVLRAEIEYLERGL